MLQLKLAKERNRLLYRAVSSIVEPPYQRAIKIYPYQRGGRINRIESTHLTGLNPVSS